MLADASELPDGPTMIAEKSLIPFSSSTGTTMRCVAPIGHSPMATGD